MPHIPTAEDLAKRNESFERAITRAINWDSIENDSNTPDFILAELAVRCLDLFAGVMNGAGPEDDAPDVKFGYGMRAVFDDIVAKRAAWYGNTAGVGIDLLRPSVGYLGNVNGPGCDPDTV